MKHVKEDCQQEYLMKMLLSIKLMSGSYLRIGGASLSWPLFVAMTKYFMQYFVLKIGQAIFMEI